MADYLSNDDFYGWKLKAFEKDHHVVFSIYCFMFLILILLSFLSQHVLTSVLKAHFIPEAAIVILVGMCLGGLLHLCRLHGVEQSTNDKHSDETYYLGFSSNIFYFGFLPPIIFNSGYHLRRRFFYRNYDAILSLAMLGTLISIAIVTYGLYLVQYYQLAGGLFESFSVIEFVAFASLISSTDPVSTLAVFSSLKVDPLLYYIVFGESILNDSIAIVVFKTASRYISHDASFSQLIICLINLVICFLGSAFIGYFMGIFLAIMYRYFDFHHHIIISIAIFLVVVYLPFFLCEIFQLSGVVSILYAGIAARRYISKNISQHEKYMFSFMMQFLSSFADTACFALLGMSTFSLFFLSSSFQFWGYGGLAALIIFGLCQVGRAAHVYPLMGMVSPLISLTIL
jgi:solute carrier family 9 (sodium/hydrogen exchanger), member 8